MIFSYERILDAIDKMYKEFYSIMNNYFEYILNLPSTINRIIKYYSFGFNENEPYKRFIMFNGRVIHEYEIKPIKVQI